MSKLSFSSNPLGTAVFTLAAPNSNTDRTLTIPDQTGTMLSIAADGAVNNTNGVVSLGGGQVVKTAGGEFLVGKTTASGDVTIQGALIGSSGKTVFTTPAGQSLVLAGLGTATRSLQEFYINGSIVGSITTSTTATSYNTSSDHRLKNNQQPLIGSGEFIDALAPKTWEWSADGSKGVGFIAHEVQAISPGSVTGKKDAVDDEGNPIYQAMEYGSAEFIANIVAELQSLRKRVAALESKQ